jgi:hypothetical protein
MKTAPPANGAQSADPSASRPDAHPAEPSIQDRKWHDTKGRFVRGNPGGPGNPFARRTALYQKALRQVVSLEDMREVMTVVKLKAKSGDMAATKIMFTYAAGKGVHAVEPDRLDIDEWKLTVEEAVDARDMKAIMTRLPVECANDIARAALPALGDGMMKTLGEGLRVDPKDMRRWIKKRQRKAERARREAERAQRRAERAQQQAAENADPSTNDEPGRAGSRERPEYPQHPEHPSGAAAPIANGEETGEPHCPTPTPDDDSKGGGPIANGENRSTPPANGG